MCEGPRASLETWNTLLPMGWATVIVQRVCALISRWRHGDLSRFAPYSKRSCAQLWQCLNTLSTSQIPPALWSTVEVPLHVLLVLRVCPPVWIAMSDLASVGGDAVGYYGAASGDGGLAQAPCDATCFWGG